MTSIVVLGAGPMGAQIACDYALGGCSVVWVDEDERAAEERIEQGLRLAGRRGLAGPADLAHARALLASRDGGLAAPWRGPGLEGRITLVTDVLLPELEGKPRILGELARAHPETLFVTTAQPAELVGLAHASGVAERMVCARYGAEPLFEAEVELFAAPDTPPRLLQRVAGLLKAIGKQPALPTHA